MGIAETAVAASLLCLLLITVLNLFPSALAAVGSSRQTHDANLLAQNALELFAARPFSGLNVGPQTFTDLAVPQGYTLAVQVENVEHYDPELLKCVRATVTWSFRNQTKKVEQELYVHPIR
jgi:hypothetical protein